MQPFRVLVALVSLLEGAALWACQYTVRDVGFVELEPQSYQLYILPDPSTFDLWNSFSQTEGSSFFLNSNVRCTILSPDDWKKNSDLSPLAERIESLPIAVLVSDQGDALILENPIRQKSSTGEILTFLSGILESPMRKEILGSLIRNHCLTLLIEGAQIETNQVLAKNIEKIHDDLNARMDRLPKPPKEGPRLLQLSPAQRKAEKILLWSLGVDERDLSNPAVAILFGRGRVIGGTMKGQEATPGEIERRIGLVGESCECELDRDWMQGKMIPLEWGTALQGEAAKTLGFDPENPMVKMEISQILKNGSGSGGAVESFAYSDDPLVGYSEVQVVNFDQETLTDQPVDNAVRVTRIVTPATEPAEIVPSTVSGSVDVALASEATPLLHEGNPHLAPENGRESRSEGFDRSPLKIAFLVTTLFFLLVLAIGLYILMSSRNARRVQSS